jgi:hypothetical protein
MEGSDRVVLDQRKVETVGFSHESSRFYAIGVTKRPRIVFGTWAEVSPLTTGPSLHGVTAVKRFDTEAGALAHMIRQGFLLPQYMLNGEHPAMPANAELGAGVLATAKLAPSTGAPRRLDLPDLVDLLYENEIPIAEMEEDCRDVVCPYLCAPLALLYNALRLSAGAELETGRVQLKATILQREVDSMDCQMQPSQLLELLTRTRSSVAIVDGDSSLLVTIGINHTTSDTFHCGCWSRSTM